MPRKPIQWQSAPPRQRKEHPWDDFGRDVLRGVLGSGLDMLGGYVGQVVQDRSDTGQANIGLRKAQTSNLGLEGRLAQSSDAREQGEYERKRAQARYAFGDQLAGLGQGPAAGAAAPPSLPLGALGGGRPTPRPGPGPDMPLGGGRFGGVLPKLKPSTNDSILGKSAGVTPAPQPPSLAPARPAFPTQSMEPGLSDMGGAEDNGQVLTAAGSPMDTLGGPPAGGARFPIPGQFIPPDVDVYEGPPQPNPDAQRRLGALADKTEAEAVTAQRKNIPKEPRSGPTRLGPKDRTLATRQFMAYLSQLNGAPTPEAAASLRQTAAEFKAEIARLDPVFAATLKFPAGQTGGQGTWEQRQGAQGSQQGFTAGQNALNRLGGLTSQLGQTLARSTEAQKQREFLAAEADKKRAAEAAQVQNTETTWGPGGQKVRKWFENAKRRLNY